MCEIEPKFEGTAKKNWVQHITRVNDNCCHCNVGCDLVISACIFIFVELVELLLTEVCLDCDRITGGVICGQQC